jgi:hypothetical protein
MTTPAFTHLIALNTPRVDEQTRQMAATALGVSLHVTELQQVATDLRNQRSLARPEAAGPNRFRLAIGTALVSLGSTVAGPRAELRAR